MYSNQILFMEFNFKLHYLSQHTKFPFWFFFFTINKAVFVHCRKTMADKISVVDYSFLISGIDFYNIQKEKRTKTPNKGG